MIANEQIHAKMLNHLTQQILEPVEPAMCSICRWTNVGLLNIGEFGSPKWVCHGCVKRMLDAIVMTLNENKHLADGDTCTLIHLKRLFPEPVAPRLVNYWCRDCRNGHGDSFREPYDPDPHAKAPPCPQGHVHNTYLAGNLD